MIGPKMVILLLLSLGLLRTVAVPVNNGVVGEPEIVCGPTSVALRVATRNAFEGRLYVKGLHNAAECRSFGSGVNADSRLELPFESCGVGRFRSLSPRGVFVRATLILSFHPLFVTKIDRALTVQCFYMEADKTVDTELLVSMLTTGFIARQPDMPVCRYELFEGGPDGLPLAFATVGTRVYHKWTCESLTDPEERFCALVHSCFVANGGRAGQVSLIDAAGCSTDVHLLATPEYLGDLMAGVESHAFKYPDLEQLYFQCQISIAVKEPGAVCPLPQCGPRLAVQAAPEQRRLAPVIQRLPTRRPPPIAATDALTTTEELVMFTEPPTSPSVALVTESHEADPSTTTTPELIMFTDITTKAMTKTTLLPPSALTSNSSSQSGISTATSTSQPQSTTPEQLTLVTELEEVELSEFAFRNLTKPTAKSDPQSSTTTTPNTTSTSTAAPAAFAFSSTQSPQTTTAKTTPTSTATPPAVSSSRKATPTSKNLLAPSSPSQSTSTTPLLMLTAPFIGPAAFIGPLLGAPKRTAALRGTELEKEEEQEGSGENVDEIFVSEELVRLRRSAIGTVDVEAKMAALEVPSEAFGRLDYAYRQQEAKAAKLTSTNEYCLSDGELMIPLLLAMVLISFLAAILAYRRRCKLE